MKYYQLLISILLLVSCTENPTNLKVMTGNAIGTTYSIRFMDPYDSNFETDIDALIKAVNKSTSTYIPSSDISRINDGDLTVVVDEFFVDVFRKSEKIYKETNGYFDPTVGILVNAWGFGPEGAIEDLDDFRIQDLLAYVGFDKVKLENNKISKMYPEIYFDFNAIGKGYLVDVIGRFFEDKNIKNYLVEIGGEIRARGKNQNDDYWRIAIENPNTDASRSFATTIQLINESIASSGNYRKFRTTPEGEKYVHTINTKTGYATESNLLSASVIAPTDCADVDGYATAFMAMGFDKSRSFLKNHPELKAFLIYADKNGDTQTYATPNLNP